MAGGWTDSTVFHDPKYRPAVLGSDYIDSIGPLTAKQRRWYRLMQIDADYSWSDIYGDPDKFNVIELNK